MLWNLVAELLLVLFITLIVGWFMGRYLCKSDEVEQRSLKNKFLKQKKLLQSQLDERDTAFKSALEQMNDLEALIGAHEQQISSLRGQAGGLNEEREQLLDELQELKQMETQRNTLIEKHKYEKQYHHRYREKTLQLTDQRDDLVTVRNKLGEQLNTAESLLQSKTIEAEASGHTAVEQEAMIKKLENERDEVIHTAKTEKMQLVQQLEADKNKAIQRLEIDRDKALQRLEAERDQSLLKLKAEHNQTTITLVNEKEATIKKIISTNNDALKTAEEAKNNALEVLNGYKKSATIKLKTSQEEYQYTLNESNKIQLKFNLLHGENETMKQRFDEQHKDYALLQQKYTTLNEESVSFEHKLKRLNEENTELRRSIDAVTIENNDYLGRLRAISSVVDVVGTEPNRIIAINSTTN